MLSHLQEQLPDWEVFETDILWDSGREWDWVWANWLRIVDTLARRPHGRLTILCGTVLPDRIARASAGLAFRAIHWLALSCDEETLESRLRERPAWRGCTDTFIAEQRVLRQWLLDNAREAFDPHLEIVDTTYLTVTQIAERVSEWAIMRWMEGEAAGKNF